MYVYNKEKIVRIMVQIILFHWVSDHLIILVECLVPISTDSNLCALDASPPWVCHNPTTV